MEPASRGVCIHEAVESGDENGDARAKAQGGIVNKITGQQSEAAVSSSRAEAPLAEASRKRKLTETSQSSGKGAYSGALHVLAALRSFKPKGVNVQSRCESCRRWCSNYCRGCMEEGGRCIPICSTELRDCYIEYHQTKAAVWLGGGETTVRMCITVVSVRRDISVSIRRTPF